jgi:hypothetical protein
MNKKDYTNQYYKHLYEKLSERAYLLEKMLKKKKIEADSKKSKKLDPVGKEDEDVDNDGKPNTKTDQYLKNRRKKIKQAMMKKKQPVEEGTIITNGELFYGGFPKLLNEVKHEIPATGNPMDSDSLAAIGVDEFAKILKSGGHPLMAGQTENGRRGVPKLIRDLAMMHLGNLKKHPQGKVDGYSADHPIFQEAQAAHEFFKDNFPAFGVEDQIAQDYNIHELKKK